MSRRSNTAPVVRLPRGIFLAPYTRHGCMVAYARTSWGEEWECLFDGVNRTESEAVAYLASLLRDHDPQIGLRLVSDAPLTASSETSLPLLPAVRAPQSPRRSTASRLRRRGSLVLG